MQQGADKRAAGELEGARPASNWITAVESLDIYQDSRQPVKEVSQICELFGIIGEKENRRGKKNGTVATG